MDHNCRQSLRDEKQWLEISHTEPFKHTFILKSTFFNSFFSFSWRMFNLLSMLSNTLKVSVPNKNLRKNKFTFCNWRALIQVLVKIFLLICLWFFILCLEIYCLESWVSTQRLKVYTNTACMSYVISFKPTCNFSKTVWFRSLITLFFFFLSDDTP